MRNLCAIFIDGILFGFAIQEICFSLYMKPSKGCIESVKREEIK